MPIHTYIDAITGESKTEEMKGDELAIYRKREQEHLELLAKEAEQSAAKKQLLDRLGITEEEARLLLG